MFIEINIIIRKILVLIIIIVNFLIVISIKFDFIVSINSIIIMFIEINIIIRNIRIVIIVGESTTPANTTCFLCIHFKVFKKVTVDFTIVVE